MGNTIQPVAMAPSSKYRFRDPGSFDLVTCKVSAAGQGSGSRRNGARLRGLGLGTSTWLAVRRPGLGCAQGAGEHGPPARPEGSGAVLAISWGHLRTLLCPVSPEEGVVVRKLRVVVARSSKRRKKWKPPVPCSPQGVSALLLPVCSLPNTDREGNRGPK